MGTSTEPNGKMEQDEDDSNNSDDLLPEDDRDEYESVSVALDQISSCLDALERQNDQLKEQFLELLESNRATRREMQQLLQEAQEETKTS